MAEEEKEDSLDKILSTIKWCVGWAVLAYFLVNGGSLLTFGLDSGQQMTCFSLGGGCKEP